MHTRIGNCPSIGPPTPYWSTVGMVCVSVAGHLGGLLALAVEGGALLPADLVHRHAVRRSDLLGQRRAEARQRRRARQLAQPRDLELGRALDHHQPVPLAEVQGHLAHLGERAE